ncbi:MAG: hypothetical protein AAFQ66_15235 [Pseudomonadota bacterium]
MAEPKRPLVVKTNTREITVEGAVVHIFELNQALAEATGVDFVSAAAAAVDSANVVKIVRELGLTGRAYVKQTRGKFYLILKGHPGLRPTLKGTRYLMSNPKVAHIAVSSRQLAAGAARMTALTAIAYTVLSTVEVLLTEEDPRFTQVFGKVASDITKFAIAAGAGYLAGAAVGAVTTVAAGPLIAAIAVGLVTTWALDRLDREFGITALLVKKLDDTVELALSPFEWAAREIHRWERYIINKAIHDALRYR